MLALRERVGVEIRRARIEAGLSQSELAKILGTQQPAISRLEAGRALPSFRTLDEIARALGMGVAFRFVKMGS